MKLNTKTNTLDNKQIRKIVNMTILWCQNNMGVNNKRRSKFKISVCKQHTKKEPLMGVFDQFDNRVIVYYNNCESVKQLICTTIHEYTHYLQPILTYYLKLYKKFGYNEHPMEVEAEENEKLYKECWNFLKINLL